MGRFDPLPYEDAAPDDVVASMSADDAARRRDLVGLAVDLVELAYEGLDREKGSYLGRGFTPAHNHLLLMGRKFEAVRVAAEGRPSDRERVAVLWSVLEPLVAEEGAGVDVRPALDAAVGAGLCGVGRRDELLRALGYES